MHQQHQCFHYAEYKTADQIWVRSRAFHPLPSVGRETGDQLSRRDTVVLGFHSPSSNGLWVVVVRGATGPGMQISIAVDLGLGFA